MFIAIVTKDFNIFADNNKAADGTEYKYTKETDFPVFTGISVEETRNHIENYFRNCYDAGDNIPEYEVCEITTVAIVKGAYGLNVSCDYLNS